MQKHKTLYLLPFVFIATALISITYAADPVTNPVVRMTTNMGVIEIELDSAHAPGTVQNFVSYARSGFYNGTIFHRVIRNFMIQGGGFTSRIEEKPARPPIKNEADNGLKNLAGTVAMARTSDPESATAQFFINTVDNSSLDYRDQTPQGRGYCVFGRVVQGMDVVRRIEAAPTKTYGAFQNVPSTPVVIEKVELLKDNASSESDQQEEARFVTAAQAYRNAAIKPALPEDARKYRVQAELAVKELQFIKAAELYGKALSIAPWWPQGHFNRAIVLR